jgi:DNA-binding transcriptional MerR regulator
MNYFSIAQLQQFSGIKAHTIRIWEQRYDALIPSRSVGNTRHYDNKQLIRLLNIVSLLDAGHKISEVGVMTDQMHAKLLEKELSGHDNIESINEYFIAQLIAASVSLDEPYFEKIFSNCVEKMGMKYTYTTVLYPMLIRTGLMWVCGMFSPAYEHFSTNIIKQKLYTAIDSMPPATSNESWLLFLPEDEFHEIGLLFSSYLIKLSGKKVIFLGGNIPSETLMNLSDEINPTHLLFFLVHNNNIEDLKEYINNLTNKFNKTQIHISGNEKLMTQLKPDMDFNWINSVEDLEKQLH